MSLVADHADVEQAGLRFDGETPAGVAISLAVQITANARRAAHGILFVAEQRPVRPLAIGMKFHRPVFVYGLHTVGPQLQRHIMGAGICRVSNAGKGMAMNNLCARTLNYIRSYDICCCDLLAFFGKDWKHVEIGGCVKKSRAQLVGNRTVQPHVQGKIIQTSVNRRLRLGGGGIVSLQLPLLIVPLNIYKVFIRVIARLPEVLVVGAK